MQVDYDRRGVSPDLNWLEISEELVNSGTQPAAKLDNKLESLCEREKERGVERNEREGKKTPSKRCLPQHELHCQHARKSLEWP